MRDVVARAGLMGAGKMSDILVIGHRNPDTDSICSAIGYAEFKQRTGMANAVPARCGDTNERIDFVLNQIGVPAPRFVADVSPRVKDVMQSEVLSVRPDSTAAEALSLMDEHNRRILPVLDSEKRCRGMLSLFKVSKFLFPASNRIIDSRRVLSSIRTLSNTLGGELLVAHNEELEQELVLMVGAMGLDSFAHRLEDYPREKLVVVVGDRWDVQNLAIREGVRVLIVTGGLAVEPKTIEAARRNSVSLISSPHDTATTAALCRASIAVRHVLNEKFMAFSENMELREARDRATQSGFLAFPVMDANGITSGIISKTDFLRKLDRKLILVDHNELSQAVLGADQVEILEIIDHHRIGSLTTHQPILFRNEPVGSTSTIVADSFFRYGVEMSVKTAGLLLAGVVADTLNLTSPTTTQVDHEVLKRLETLSGIDARKFTENLFTSGSLLTHRPAPDAITTDCKEYQESNFTFSVAQIEEIGFDQFWKRKPDLVRALDEYRAEHKYAFSALLVTDVTSQSSLLLIQGEPRITSRIDYPLVEPGIYQLENIVSRKKQLLPYLTHLLNA